MKGVRGVREPYFKELHGPPNQVTFCKWMHRTGYLHRLIMIILVVILIVPLITHYYLSNAELSPNTNSELESQVANLMNLKPTELRSHIQEMYAIRQSVQKELRELEEKRRKVQGDVAYFETKLQAVRSNLKESQTELEKVKQQLDQAMKEQMEIVERSMQHIAAPVQILPPVGNDQTIEPPSEKSKCRQHNCFDYSRCSLVSKFNVFLYGYDVVSQPTHHIDVSSRTLLSEVLKRSVYVTSDPAKACIFVALIWDAPEEEFDEDDFESRIRGLEFWRGDGRNHVLIFLADKTNSRNLLSNLNTGRAMIVQSLFNVNSFRRGFDLVIPPLTSVPKFYDESTVTRFSPARRKWMLSFEGKRQTLISQSNNINFKHDNHISRKLLDDPVNDERGESSAETMIIDEIQKMTSYEDDEFHFEFDCEGSLSCDHKSNEWCLCGSATDRSQIIRQSTFTLILLGDGQVSTSNTILQRIMEGLQHGAIPVVLGEQIVLPFCDFIQWNKAVFTLPFSRVTELYYFLKRAQDVDILNMRIAGMNLFRTYFSKVESIFSGVLSTIRTRLIIPAEPIKDTLSTDLYPPGHKRKEVKITKIMAESDDFFPAPEPPFNSPHFLRNFTSTYINRDSVWNSPPGPFYLYPQYPFDPVMPSEAQFRGSSLGFRPIANGIGGSGKEYQESLGGNIPREQFTIVILTYKREAVLMSSLERLMGLPFLNKVIVVWNSPDSPEEDLVWPLIHVPIKVIKAEHNSLNNRFLPYDEIETEAVLSMDDDAHLRHDEMLFGFRVWRENRGRIVGFPGRYHAWDIHHNTGFLYNANYTCELSMVLTGAAFFHKFHMIATHKWGGRTGGTQVCDLGVLDRRPSYYMYLYSYFMPEEIRDKVDEYMNCEDIAMNFLVSHITRKPPVKVTSRWTFRCPGCPDSLSLDDSHFQERHLCIQYFSKIYGYTPLLYTQYRVDSVLFKTRIPRDKQKCFKFI